ncbi:S1 family peptidase [Streptomyces monticola]|uniref:S1 family peptidase n=1 Tax=Streptomyces monticola TaxID=2666263 RepID=A0ABW2JCW3_9ACTN
MRAHRTVTVVLVLLCAWLLAPQTALSRAAVEVRGGDRIYSDRGGRCTVGFNARGGEHLYALVSGHCVQGAATWFADPALTVPIAETGKVSFPGDDFAVLRYTNTSVSYPGEVSLGPAGVRDITGAAAPSVGQGVCRTGGATGYRCGTVRSLNVTVSYPEGTVYGLFQATLCADPGDGHGPAFSGTKALGLAAGASGNCASGGSSFYQPVTEALSAHGLTLY